MHYKNIYSVPTTYLVHLPDAEATATGGHQSLEKRETKWVTIEIMKSIMTKWVTGLSGKRYVYIDHASQGDCS